VKIEDTGSRHLAIRLEPEEVRHLMESMMGQLCSATVGGPNPTVSLQDSETGKRVTLYMRHPKASVPEEHADE
jgi:hypothetical protein